VKLPIGLSLRFVPIRDLDPESFRGFADKGERHRERLAPSPLVF
jgi:hypothetical protein